MKKEVDFEAALIAPASALPRLLGFSALRRSLARAAILIAQRLLRSPLSVAIPERLADVPTAVIPYLPLVAKFEALGIVQRAEIGRGETSSTDPKQLYFQVRPKGYGNDFFDIEKAFWRGFGENLERVLWAERPFDLSGSETTSARDMKERGVDLERIVGFSQEQRSAHQFLTFNEHTPFTWVKARSLTDKSSRWAPIQLFSAHYARARVNITLEYDSIKEPLIRWPVSTGLATGRSLDEALLRGFLEVIERDAFMIMWMNKLSMPRIDLNDLASGDTEFKEIMKRIRGAGVEAYVMELPTDFPAHGYFACIVDQSGEGPAFALGASMRESPRRAVIAALAEALSVRRSVKTFYKNKEYEETETLNRDERLAYWAQRIERLKSLEFMWKGPPKKISPEAWNIPDHKNAWAMRAHLSNIIRTAREKGYDMLYLELTPREIRRLGFHSIYALMPQLQPLHLFEKVPYRSGARLSTVPKELGYESAKELNTDPHPFP